MYVRSRTERKDEAKEKVTDKETDVYFGLEAKNRAEKYFLDTFGVFKDIYIFVRCT